MKKIEKHRLISVASRNWSISKKMPHMEKTLYFVNKPGFLQLKTKIMFRGS